MNPEPKKPEDCQDEDEITMAKSIFDEIVEETEREDDAKPTMHPDREERESVV